MHVLTPSNIKRHAKVYSAVSLAVCAIGSSASAQIYEIQCYPTEFCVADACSEAHVTDPSIFPTYSADVAYTTLDVAGFNQVIQEFMRLPTSTAPKVYRMTLPTGVFEYHIYDSEAEVTLEIHARPKESTEASQQTNAVCPTVILVS